MEELFKPRNNTEQAGKDRGKEALERYKNIPAAKPRLFVHSEGTEAGTESPFKFLPIHVSVTQEALMDVAEHNSHTKNEIEYGGLGKRLSKLKKEVHIIGDYLVTCCMREEGDNNSIDKMIANIDEEDSWKPAKIEHLLILAQTNPELFDDPVVALGSEVKQIGNIPCLHRKNGRVEFAEHYRHGGFNRNYSFLIVRQK